MTTHGLGGLLFLHAGISGGADEVGEDAVSAGHTFGELAVEGEAKVNPRAATGAGDEQAAKLRLLAVVVGFEQRGVVRVPGGHEAVAALFDPVVEVGGGDLVGPGEERVVGRDDLDGGVLFNDLFAAAEIEWVGAGAFGQAAGVVLGDDDAAGCGVGVEGWVGGGEFGMLVGADAEDDGVVGLEGFRR